MYYSCYLAVIVFLLRAMEGMTMELIHIMAANKQIVYFICHPIRAVETEIDESAREEYVKLAEETRKMLAVKKTAPAAEKKQIIRSRKRSTGSNRAGSAVSSWQSLPKPSRTAFSPWSSN